MDIQKQRDLLEPTEIEIVCKIDTDYSKYKNIILIKTTNKL